MKGETSDGYLTYRVFAIEVVATHVAVSKLRILTNEKYNRNLQFLNILEFKKHCSVVHAKWQGNFLITDPFLADWIRNPPHNPPTSFMIFMGDTFDGFIFLPSVHIYIYIYIYI